MFSLTVHLTQKQRTGRKGSLSPEGPRHPTGRLLQEVHEGQRFCGLSEAQAEEDGLFQFQVALVVHLQLSLQLLFSLLIRFLGRRKASHPCKTLTAGSTKEEKGPLLNRQPGCSGRVCGRTGAGRRHLLPLEPLSADVASSSLEGTWALWSPAFPQGSPRYPHSATSRSSLPSGPLSNLLRAV